MRKTVPPAGILIVASIVVVACARSGGTAETGASANQAPAKSSSATPVTALDACTLLTKQEAAAALGEAVKEPTSTGAGSAVTPGINAAVSSCDYESATTTHDVKLNVYRSSPDLAAQLRQTYQAVVCAKKEPLSGLGDVACWYDSNHGELQVLKGATLLVVELSRRGDATEAITTVAKKALARVP